MTVVQGFAKVRSRLKDTVVMTLMHFPVPTFGSRNYYFVVKLFVGVYCLNGSVSGLRFLDSSNEHWTKPGLTTVGKRRNDKSDFSTLGVFLWTDEEGNVIVACAIVNQSSIES